MKYDFNDPEDVARFHLNMLCGDLAMALRDYANHFGHDKCEPQVLARFTELAVAVKKLDSATAPKEANHAVRP